MRAPVDPGKPRPGFASFKAPHAVGDALTSQSSDALARVRAAFTAPEPAGVGEPPGVSAVLLPLYETPAGLGLLYTKRSERLAKHPGQVSFPGGRMDPGDATPLAAALREADEEVGIAPAHVEVMGHVTDMVTYYGALVRAYAGLVREAPPTAPRSHEEVEMLFLKPLTELLSPSHYEGRAFRDEEGTRRTVHYFRGAHPTIWGITGEITARFLARAYSWEPVGTPRLISEMHEFVP